ncbi:MAG: molybdopterin-dependent oxidoreductase [Chloroflexota bacterium]|nr:molybdopterin-dependent oxidoreductase [Chloroflexota bacterium]
MAIDTVAPDAAPARRAWGPLAGRLLVGLLAGLTAAIILTLLQLAMRRWLGISPPQEMIPDRLAPTIGIDRFLDTLRRFGGYNQAKRFGIQSGLTGVLVAGTVVGGLYGGVTGWRRGTGGSYAIGRRRGIRFIALAGLTMWVLSMLALWPTLDTNFKGLPPQWAEAATAVGYAVAYAVFALLVVGLYDVVVRPVAGVVPGPAGAISQPALGSGDRVIKRRTVAVAALGAVATWPALSLLRWFEDRATFSYDGRRYSGSGIQPITPNGSFYSVTKNLVDPDVNRGVYRLAVDGMVDRSLRLTYDDLVAIGGTEQETTIMCISNRISSGLMSNAVWTGVPLTRLLDDAGADRDGYEVVLRGADGYTDTIPMAKALEPTTMVVWLMNGEALPRVNGDPVRAIVPGLYGEKHVKWLTGIEVVDHDVEGFYEEQGWGPDFVVPTRSDFFSPGVTNRGGFVFADEFRRGRAVTLRGRAYAGDRGIERVEVSTDGEATWTRAEIDYQTTPIAWVFWSFQWTPAAAGEFPLAVRAVDGLGGPQETRRRASFPREGDTGLHRVRAVVR